MHQKFLNKNIASIALAMKRKKLSIISTNLSCLLLSSLFTLPIYASPINNSLLIQKSPKEVIDQVWQIIYRDYMAVSKDFSQNEWLQLRKKLLSAKYQNSEDSYEAIRAMLATLDDPYTRFLDPKEFNEMRIDTSGELTGIGIQISIDEVSKEVVVVAPIEGTPAFNAGIQPKDIISSINGTLTKGMSVDNVVKLIRGKKGTSVNIGIRRNNKFKEFTLIRERISIRTVISRLNKTKTGIKIGYIRIKQFSANAAKEMRYSVLALEKQNPDAYIVDLRGNPGGLLEASIDIARQLLDRGIIVSTLTKDGVSDVRRAKGNALTSRPLAVLVNEGSASASEILSGAIQDNNRGILVGKKTFGKGLVQSVRTLVDGSGITVTVAKYLTPNGKDINKNGIKPDFEASINTRKNKKLIITDLGTYSDGQYVVAENALIRMLNKSKLEQSFVPKSSNLKYALNTPCCK